MPQISVIVPVYNTEKYLHRCIDSILAQTFTDFELLLVDDGSTDSSGEICNEYAAKDSRVRVFHKANGGVSSARNLGLDNAKGEWITFVDSDDELTAFFSMVTGLGNEDICIFPYMVLSNNSYLQPQILDDDILNKKELDVFIRTYSIRGILKTSWGKFYKKSKISSLRFEKEMRVGEDQLFLLQYLSKVESCRTFSTPLYIYKGGFCSQKYNLSVCESIDIMKKLVYAYDAFNDNKIDFYKDVFLVYKNLCQRNIDMFPAEWFDDAFVKDLWNKIKEGCTRIYRVKYFLLSFPQITNLRNCLKNHTSK